MATEATGVAERKDEREFCGRFEAHLRRLATNGRCEWAPQVRMLHWRHAHDAERTIIRIDYVARLDDGPLIGLEAKVGPEKAADLGRHLKQCSDYADSVIAGHANTPRGWVGKPLKAVFLAMELHSCRDYVRQHYNEATRLMGPFNIGFVCNSRTGGLALRLCDEFYWWSEQRGYAANALSRNTNRRVGNGSFQLPAEAAWPNL